MAKFDLKEILAERLIEDNEACHEANEASPDCQSSHVTVQCVPFYSALKAIGNPKVDYFSLDVDGPDLQVLKTIPWDKVRRVRSKVCRIRLSNQADFRIKVQSWGGQSTIALT